MLGFIKKNSVWLILLIALIVAAIFLRSTNLMGTAPSLYWEEVALGYDAYSISQTGKDHHGNPWPIVAFESFGDWKPSLYFYVLVPFISLLGLEAWVVRLPSVLSGISIVLAVGWLSYITANRLHLAQPRNYGLLGILVATLSPWAVQFSRAGWEVNLATALVSWGMVTGLQVIQITQTKSKLHSFFKLNRAIGCVILLVLAVYAYHGTRVIAPLLGFLLALDWIWQLRHAKYSWLQLSIKMLIPATIGLLLIIPVLLGLRSPQVSQRFAETSIFGQLDNIIESNTAKEATGNSLLSKLFFHRYIYFGREVATNFLDHFNLSYLAVTGDPNPRHSTQYGGLLHFQDLAFLAVGLLFLVYRKNRVSLILIGWWLISILPAALTTATPHALRTLPALPAVTTIIALGIGLVFSWWQQLFSNNKVPVIIGNLFFIIAIATSYSLSFAFWWHHYQNVYPKQTSSEWQYGYQQMIQAVEQLTTEQPNLPVYITREQGRPAMYYWFFSKTSPERVQAANAVAQKDQGEYVSFETMTFPNSVSEVKQVPAIVASSVAGKEQLKKDGHTISSEVSISDLAGKTVWTVYKIE